MARTKQGAKPQAAEKKQPPAKAEERQQDGVSLTLEYSGEFTHGSLSVGQTFKVAGVVGKGDDVIALSHYIGGEGKKWGIEMRRNQCDRLIRFLADAERISKSRRMIEDIEDFKVSIEKEGVMLMSKKRSAAKGIIPFEVISYVAQLLSRVLIDISGEGQRAIATTPQLVARINEQQAQINQLLQANAQPSTGKPN